MSSGVNVSWSVPDDLEADERYGQGLVLTFTSPPDCQRWLLIAKTRRIQRDQKAASWPKESALRGWMDMDVVSIVVDTEQFEA